jgi:hypothetical protein
MSWSRKASLGEKIPPAVQAIDAQIDRALPLRRGPSVRLAYRAVCLCTTVHVDVHSAWQHVHPSHTKPRHLPSYKILLDPPMTGPLHSIFQLTAKTPYRQDT